jgi:NADPH-dependent glutamate synthase beta subunit-like oxidoreductase
LQNLTVSRLCPALKTGKEIHGMTMETPTQNNIAVIGAGVAGLAIACRLAAKGAKVTVFEKKRHSRR